MSSPSWLAESRPEAPQLIQRSFSRNNLDLTSVLRTVLDYYESFFRQACPQLKLDILKATLYLANTLFDSRQQYESLMFKLQSTNFEWLAGFTDTADQPDLVDESTLALAVYAECLCRCCLQTSRGGDSMPAKELDRLSRLFESGFKANSLSVRLATVHGLLYWLESIALGYVTNSNDAKLITDHLCKQIQMMRNSGGAESGLTPGIIVFFF